MQVILNLDYQTYRSVHGESYGDVESWVIDAVVDKLRLVGNEMTGDVPCDHCLENGNNVQADWSHEDDGRNVCDDCYEFVYCVRHDGKNWNAIAEW